MSEGLPSVAVITMARDEATMLPRWVAHYADQVGAENLLVIDDNSADGSTDGLPCPVIRIPQVTKKGFEPARLGMISSFAQALLEVHDAVIFCDADEFIVADPDKHESLRHFVAARAGSSVVGVMNLNVVHDVRNEPPLDPALPILGQRRLAKFLPLMCKPSLKWVPARWVLASHGVKAPYAVDPELFMFHMKFADRDHLRTVAAQRKQVVEMDGRASTTSWQRGADDMVAMLEEITVDLDRTTVEPFKVPVRQLGGIVEAQPSGVYRAVGAGQVQAMRGRPFVEVPRRFEGVL